MRDAITDAAARVLVRDGLAGWSVDRVALEAGCAKGLVHYHHGTKRELLQRVATSLAAARQAHRVTALTSAGAAALDRLWLALVREVRSGEFAAWCAIAAAPKIEGPPSRATDSEALAAAVARALDLAPWDPARAILLPAALDGLQLALLLGAPESQVREAYHLLWLTLLP